MLLGYTAKMGEIRLLYLLCMLRFPIPLHFHSKECVQKAQQTEMPVL
jgi:hypothetical protein